ncbi:Crp/Fnr family transcriptional regulator [Sphingobacterium alkalisoli]|uniref:Crp/Fnr family transcriptional regulator n=1 Tax=Sphingobacterium alkalisoli TaxID=1874115 RepID=A0A4U0GX20_9SPHI|nr:Crp/Fnr family transcriptional regulator [Sphingobacterium alkalisoli]TJY63710.1 Crp/Fnr family transcriptional regulator [Sphingobacterium alkalisoli]GGH25395.1 cyclic nucleotide-binding protein [Sphingobacterium alkalisoli]
MSKEIRQHIERIVPLTDNEFDFVLSHFTPKKFKKHQFLIQESNYVPHDFWVIKGLVKAYHSDIDGKEHIMQFAMEDWWVTDYQAYFNQTKATLNVSCLEDTEVLCLSLENRDKICAELHKVEHFFRKKSNAGFVSLQRRILSLLNSNARERYEQFLVQYPNLLQRVPKTLIASYLGVSRETLSRFSSL